MMHSDPFRAPSPALPLWVVVVLATFYLLAGIAGHDPLRAEDAIHIAIARDFAAGGDWLSPRVAGELWPHTAPLYHWVAALTGRTFGDLLGFAAAARLATPLFGALFLFALAGAARAGRTSSSPGDGRIAPLLAIGTLGLLLPLHDAQPAVAGLACAALAWWGAGLILEGRQRWRGTLLLGLGAGLAFPAHGLAGLVMAAPALLAPLLRRDARSSVLAVLLALPLLLAWPALAGMPGAEFWTLWWHNELAEVNLARGLPRLRHLEQILWATWPALPLALWSLRLHQGRLGELALPLIGTTAGLAWFLSGAPRDLSLLPLMIPLLLLAAAGAERLRRGAANAFDWFARFTFGFVVLLIWLGASAQALGWPPRIARNFAKLAPDFAVAYPPLLLAFAAALTLAWLWSWRLPRAGWRAGLHWATGTTLMWCLVTTLWMPWIDHYKSYRSLVAELRAALPPDAGCLERVRIGVAQRAALDDFAGLRTVPRSAGLHCGWRLSTGPKDRTAPPGWIEYWEGGRPSDRKERWYLDRRAEPVTP